MVFVEAQKNKHKYVHFDFYFHFYSGYLFNNIIIIGYEWRINNSLFFLSRTHQSVNAPFQPASNDCVRFFASTLFGVRSHLDKGDKIWYSFISLWRTTSATIRVYTKWMRGSSYAHFVNSELSIVWGYFYILPIFCFVSFFLSANPLCGVLETNDVHKRRSETIVWHRH